MLVLGIGLLILGIRVLVLCMGCHCYVLDYFLFEKWRLSNTFVLELGSSGLGG